MEDKKQEIARKNMYMSEEVANWYVEEALRLGVSQSALMTMVLSNYIDQKKSMDMGETLKKILEMVKNNEEITNK
jgi:hypothetical protein